MDYLPLSFRIQSRHLGFLLATLFLYPHSYFFLLCALSFVFFLDRNLNSNDQSLLTVTMNDLRGELTVLLFGVIEYFKVRILQSPVWGSKP